MKKVIWCLINAIVICEFIFLSSSIFAKDENITTDTELVVKEWEPLKHTLVFKADGQLEIDGKPVEKMSVPEIKVAVKEIATAMKKQAENDELVRYYDRQMGFLLWELERCLNSR